MELLRFNAEAFCRLMGLLGQMLGYSSDKNYPIEDVVDNFVTSTIGEIKIEAEKLELRSTLQQLRRIEARFATNADLPSEEARLLVNELYNRVTDELAGVIFLSVPFYKVSYYEQREPLFGGEVAVKFDKFTEDISEAGKCLALGRYTATVFHLMRIMEAGLQKFGDKLGVALVTEKNWQKILNDTNKPIKAMAENKDPLATTYAAVAAHLYNVKVAWRNEVMHPKQTYTEEEAEDIFRNVKTFISDLTHLI